MTGRIVGNTVAEWGDATPLKFSLKDKPTKSNPIGQALEVDLNPFTEACERAFLLHVKDFLIDRCNRVSLRTVEGDVNSLKACFLTIYRKEILANKIEQVNEALLLGISPFHLEFPSRALGTLRTAFNDSPHSLMFAEGLNDSDFRFGTNKLGQLGQKKKTILSTALTRASVVEILRIAEELYEAGDLDIGHFSFLNLAFAVYCRIDSYRTITLSDLDYRKSENAWYLWIHALKHRVHGPVKIPYKINARLADILLDQRDHVIKTYGHLVAKSDHPQLALFPARALALGDSRWLGDYANSHYGQMPRGDSYFDGLQNKKAWRTAIKKRLTTNALRHTVGTQMAQAGLKAWAIQAVLKHATDLVCQIYVDIFAEGMIEQLSDALQPAFEHRLPVFQRFRTKSDPVSSAHAIECEDDAGRVEFVGECGTELRCDAAPLGCYDCSRFIPCWDADHSINLNDVEREINKCKRAGLAYQDHVKKGQHIKYKIILVMNACDLIQQSQANSRQEAA